MEAKLHIFLSLAPEGGEWSALSLDREPLGGLQNLYGHGGDENNSLLLSSSSSSSS
jgi:hypothetical protein